MSTFGTELRAARTGFRWLPAMQGYVRVSPAGEGRWLTEVARTAGAMVRRGVDFHVCWWEGHPTGAAMFGASPWMQELARCGRPFDYAAATLDDDGEEVAT